MNWTFSNGTEYFEILRLIQSKYKKFYLVVFFYLWNKYQIVISYLQHIIRASDMMFDNENLQIIFCGTYNIMQCAAVTTQFELMMEPPQLCDPKNRSDTWNSNMHYHWTEMGWTTAFI